MTTITADIGATPYDIVIEAGGIDRAERLLATFARDNRIVVISDEQVWAAQGSRLTAGLGAVSIEAIVLPVGEATKSWSVLASLVDRLLELGIERSDHVVAFGGGVIGDLVGFAASIVKRGCNFVQVPTSLLAQVDSSVGGKTAINVPAGKNMVGAFHQPALVLIDPTVLGTLPDRQMRAGYAEIAKYALIENAPFFDWLLKNSDGVLARDSKALEYAIVTAVAGKVAVVAEDERETSGRRALLNLGHTFGHALEAETGFSDRLLHGEAVAVGITLAFNFSAARGLLPDEDAVRVRDHFSSVGLPLSLGREALAAGGERLVMHMRHDKKSAGGRLPFILARGIGKAFVDPGVDLADVADFLDRIVS